MFETIFDSFRDKTVIYILHRLSSATFADRIYLLENGQIAEQGTHSELIAQNGKYADMFHKQAGKIYFVRGFDRGLKWDQKNSQQEEKRQTDFDEKCVVTAEICAKIYAGISGIRAFIGDWKFGLGYSRRNAVCKIPVRRIGKTERITDRFWRSLFA